MNKYQEYARKNYRAGDSINDLWHPDIIAECMVMNEEREEGLRRKEAEKKAADRKRVQEVVEKTADIDALMTGKIGFTVHFSGSVPKDKPLTNDESVIVMKMGSAAEVKGRKILLVSREYDALSSWISNRREEFKRFGIPNPTQDSTTVTAITSIPDVETLSEKTEVDLPIEVEKFLSVYPAQILAQKDKLDRMGLGALFNSRDYRTSESIRASYRFRYEWTGYGALDALKQTNVSYYKKALKRAEEVWQEIEANGVLLLRSTIAELVDGLADSLTPKDGGEKKKFYASSVTKIQDFISVFEQRNICDDQQLEQEVQKLREVVSGVDLKKMSSDEALRKSVREKMESAKQSLGSLVVSAEARVIEFE